jgi:hypothetical protein
MRTVSGRAGDERRADLDLGSSVQLSRWTLVKVSAYSELTAQ